ncbi:YSC84-related protein [Amaricoccus solimangrovi]|uniref:Twin-arginine translocation pathway signal n=1 Tax=Amaricoccus solimangrovi TaxID=2589815 RepID=A0A501WV56_9RHOB|nr:YSC84-related protein [Amaricoccus solimangrovi]TPE53643.1 twin-arginine translocation pathway signal [Amaricoccus solimangrovi]
MTSLTRRGFLAVGGVALAACTSRTPEDAAERRQALNAEIEAARQQLLGIRGAPELIAAAQGVLIIPNVRQVGFFASGAYGEGALFIGPAIVEYYSLSLASVGFTFGAAAYNQALFFMTSQALQDFRLADGWQLGAGVQVVGGEDGVSAGVTTTRINRPIQELVFGQRGLIADASFAGAKYNRIVR